MVRREFHSNDYIYRDHNRGSNWLWLIPLLALPLLAWGAWRAYDNTGNNPNGQAYVLISPEPSSPDNDGNSRPNTPTNTGTDNSTVGTDTGNTMSVNLSEDGTRTVTPGIGGGGGITDTTPNGVPDTGLGGMSR